MCCPLCSLVWNKHRMGQFLNHRIIPVYLYKSCWCLSGQFIESFCRWNQLSIMKSNLNEAKFSSTFKIKCFSKMRDLAIPSKPDSSWMRFKDRLRLESMSWQKKCRSLLEKKKRTRGRKRFFVIGCPMLKPSDTGARKLNWGVSYTRDQNLLGFELDWAPKLRAQALSLCSKSQVLFWFKSSIFTVGLLPG